ncbi:MAG: TetR/AcrR family transcriptional regulator [Nitrospiraceae bacterium]
MSQRVARKTREFEWRRQDILDAAERLFSKNGFFKTSMAEIAEEAGFAIGTVYQFFKSKEDMYISLIEVKMEKFAALINERVDAVTSATDKIEAVIRTKLEFFEQNRDFFRIYVSEWSGFEWTIKSAFGEQTWKRYQKQLALVAEIMRMGVRRGEFRAVDPDEAAYALHGMLNSTIYLWILQVKPPGSLAAKSGSLLTLFIRGVSRPTSRARND